MTHEVGPGYAGCLVGGVGVWWLLVLARVVRAVVARRVLLKEEADQARRSIYSKVRKSHKLVIGHWREIKGRARSQWRSRTSAGSA